MSQPLLAVEGLMMRFGGLLAVNNVALELHPQEIVNPPSTSMLYSFKSRISSRDTTSRIAARITASCAQRASS
jgi:ABC-type phosphonate transport system ATPase subunit